MARSGQASVEVLADFSRFAATFQRDLNAALRGVRLDMTGVSNQIANGVKNGVDAANQELRRLSDQAGDSFDRIAQQSERASRSMAQSFASAGRQMSSVGDQMTMALSLPIAAVGTATIAAAGNFEKSMNRVKALSGATAEEFAKLREQAIELGSTTQYSASQAADAMGYLSMAGFTATQTLDALPGVLNLAAAGSIELADAADIASNILSGYGYQAADLATVNDVLAKTFTSTNTTLMSLGETFKYVGPVAASAGVDFAELSAAIGLMGNAGIQGSEAGTALRGAIARLLKPTGEVSETLDALGVSVVDSSGKLRPLVDIVRQLEKSGADTADMMTIFGLEAGPAMQALVSQGSGALATLTKNLDSAGGTAERIATTQMEGFNGALDELKSAAEGLMIAIGDAGLLGFMTDLADQMTVLVSAASALSPTVLKVGTVVAAVVAVIGPMLAVFGRLVTAIAEGVMAIRAFGGWLVKIAPWLSGLAGPIGWAIAAVVALGAALVVAYKKSEAFRSVVDRVFRAVSAAASSLWSGYVKPAMEGIAAAARRVGAALLVLLGQARPIFDAIANTALRVWGVIASGARSIWGSMSSAGGAIAGLWSGTLQPAFDAILAGFQMVGAAVVGWWRGNGDAVMAAAGRAVSAVGTVIVTVAKVVMGILRAVAAVVAWLVTTIIVPAVKVIVAVVRAIVGAVVALRPVWVAIGAVIGAVVMAIVAMIRVVWAVIKGVFTAIVAVVKAVITVFKVLWSIFGPIVVAIGQLIGTIIKGTVLVIFELLKTAISAIIVWVKILWAVFSPVFKAIAAIAVWLWGALQPVFQAIGAVFVWLWQKVSSVVTWIVDKFKSMWQWIVSIFNMCADAIKSFVSRAVSFAQGLAGFVNSVKNKFNQVVSAVRDKLNQAVNAVKGLPSRVTGAIGNMGRLLYDAGKKIVQGLIDGMSSMWSSLKNKVSSLASTVRDYLPFSPAKVGPLSGSGDPTISGGKIVNMVADGMENRLPTLRAAAWGMADAAMLGSGGPTAGPVGGTAPVASALGRGGVVFAAGAINVTFAGVVPTEGEARRTGRAIGEGVADSLTGNNLSVQLRSI